MSEEINIKFYDPEVEELKKENQQLKEMNRELISVLKKVRKDINFAELCDGYLVIEILDKAGKQ